MFHLTIQNYSSHYAMSNFPKKFGFVLVLFCIGPDGFDLYYSWWFWSVLFLMVWSVLFLMVWSVLFTMIWSVLFTMVGSILSWWSPLLVWNDCDGRNNRIIEWHSGTKPVAKDITRKGDNKISSRFLAAGNTGIRFSKIRCFRSISLS